MKKWIGFILILLTVFLAIGTTVNDLRLNGDKAATAYIIIRKGASQDTVIVIDTLGNYYVWYNRVVLGKSNYIGNTGIYSTIAGGINDTITNAGDYSFIGGGEGNKITNHHNGIVGGQNNLMNGTYNFIGGGYNNTFVAGANHSAMCGTHTSTCKVLNSFIGGGYHHDITGNYNGVVGGENVDLGASHSFGTGHNCIIRGAWDDEACAVFGNGSIVDSSLATIAFNCQIKNQDSILAVSKAIWVIGPTDTNIITPTGITHSFYYDSSDVAGWNFGNYGYNGIWTGTNEFQDTIKCIASGDAEDSSFLDSPSIEMIAKADTATGNPVVNIETPINLQMQGTWVGDGTLPCYWLGIKKADNDAFIQFFGNDTSGLSGRFIGKYEMLDTNLTDFTERGLSVVTEKTNMIDATAIAGISCYKHGGWSIPSSLGHIGVLGFAKDTTASKPVTGVLGIGETESGVYADVYGGHFYTLTCGEKKHIGVYAKGETNNDSSCIGVYGLASQGGAGAEIGVYGKGAIAFFADGDIDLDDNDILNVNKASGDTSDFTVSEPGKVNSGFFFQELLQVTTTSYHASGGSGQFWGGFTTLSSDSFVFDSLRVVWLTDQNDVYVDSIVIYRGYTRLAADNTVILQDGRNYGAGTTIYAPASYSVNQTISFDWRLRLVYWVATSGVAGNVNCCSAKVYGHY